ncbi:MAG: hypothetical protein KBS91_01605, partial [Firmicutes bacterium]|nr:hypothetical protein [Candidatus Caballimonas caccae]
EVYDSLKEVLEDVENIIFTGEEDLSKVTERVNEELSLLKKALLQDYTNKLIEASDNFLYYLDSFRAISCGEIEFIDEEEVKAQKLSWSKKKLYARLDELKEIKETFNSQDNRLENDIKGLEKDLAELDNKILNEDNERSINELYRKVSALKSKLDMLNVRRSNYSACFNVLDIIYANANEILTASEFSIEEASKAKVLLNIGKLKAVINEPDEAISILKTMEKDIKTISDKVKSMDEKVFGLKGQETSVTDSALAYKEELMRKKREKEANAENLSDLKAGTKTDNNVKGEN